VIHFMVSEEVAEVPRFVDTGLRGLCPFLVEL